MGKDLIYTEKYRPRFHFTARKNWLNDPNGCVLFAGEYHLFFQHNPHGNEWGNMTWGHATSPDLVHWHELPCAILPYGGGDIFSGSAVVDWNNTSGLGDGIGPPIVAIFTHARSPCEQALAYSIDKGRNWRVYNSGQYVVPNQGLDGYERDPKIFWHLNSRKWIMALWVKTNTVRFFTSDDLIHWSHASDFVGDGFWECPDLIELPVDGDVIDKRWVLNDANFNYWIGTFDGKTFQPESGPFQGDFGANFYAAQTWNSTENRVVQIAWMRGGEYPRMPFNQQMSFPCELSLRKTSDGVRLYRLPVPEIESLYKETTEFRDMLLDIGQDLDTGIIAGLLDIEIEVELSSGASFSVIVHGRSITCGSEQITCLGNTAPLALKDGIIHFRLLIDRTSIELFGNHGEVSMSSCFLPEREFTSVQCRADSAPVYVKSLIVHRLCSAWE
ncbi:MAG: glycosidase [Chloroflexi bacterium]|nr:glycosidase [Chloroflexota bacterium]